MELIKLKFMANTVSCLNAILETIEQGDDFIISKVKETNQEFQECVSAVETLAKEKNVTIRVNDSSTYSTIFRKNFNFWTESPLIFFHYFDRYTKPKLDRYEMFRQIKGGIYSLDLYTRISKPTKKNLVKCPERLKYDMNEYEKIETYKDGTFKIQADAELLWLIQFINEFNKKLDKWVRRES